MRTFLTKMNKNQRFLSTFFQVLAQMVLSGCVRPTTGSAMMGNSSFDQAQDIAQDLRFASACANNRASLQDSSNSG